MLCLVFKFNNLTELQAIRDVMSVAQLNAYAPNEATLVVLMISAIFGTFGMFGTFDTFGLAWPTMPGRVSSAAMVAQSC